MTQARFACSVLAAALLALPAALAQDNRIDAAFQKFWAADSPVVAGPLGEEVVKTGVTFDDALRRLKQGRAYGPQQSGVFIVQNRTEDGVEHFYAVNVPPHYDPARRYQVRFQLHGGIGARQDNKPRGTGEIGPLAGAEQIYVLPWAWEDAPWWDNDQVLNLRAIVDSLKRTYNVDENHVALAGVSDGASGSYYIAMRETTVFSSIIPLNGFIMVLSSNGIDDGHIFPNNLLNKPLFVVNGGQDRLYPIRMVEPFTKHLMKSGVEVEYHPRPEAEHNTRWWPEMKDPFEKFVAEHPRDPHPARLTWTAADPRYGRAHWLVIDELGPAPGEAKQMPDVNTIEESDAAEPPGLFEREAYGRVDLERSANTVRAATKGVAAFTLLLSPDKFDFSQPVKVVANGREVFNGRVTQDVKTLMKWAARDNDRTMLYGAELKIKLTR